MEQFIGKDPKGKEEFEGRCKHCGGPTGELLSVCPLRTLMKAQGSFDSLCIGNRCGWFDTAHGRCAVLSICMWLEPPYPEKGEEDDES